VARWPGLILKSGALARQRLSACLAVGLLALTIAARAAPALAQAPASTAEREATLTVTVVPRSASGAFRDTTLVYLDGRIDAGAPDRLSKALDGINGRTAIWLNSAGGNLFAGMQLGRIIRRHGASTNIIDARTLLPGRCYSACSLAFLGGVYRFGDNGARYGVHSASLGPAGESADRVSDLSGAVGSYIREMDVDVRLLDLWTKARPDQMYVLSRKEAEDLGVVNNGRKPSEWSVAPGAGSRLQGRQVTVDGTGTVFFSCDGKQTLLGSAYEAEGTGQRRDSREGSYWLTIDGSDAAALTARRAPDGDGLRPTFALPPDLVRRARLARQIGLRSPSISYGVDVDDRSAPIVRSFLGNCLRGQAK